MESAAPRRATPADRTAAAESERAAARERTRKHQQAAARARSRAATREEQAQQESRTYVLDGQLPADRYLDREDSWLRFSQRILELAEDQNVPLLERVRFSSIFASGMDEFFGVRIAGRIRRMATGLPVENATGLPSEQILQNALQFARELTLRNARCFSDLLRAGPRRRGHRDPALEGTGAR